jgi:hypothetical protein
MAAGLDIKSALQTDFDDASENEIIKLANKIAKKDLRLIARKIDEVSTFDEARTVTAYKQAAVRSKGEQRQALAGVDTAGLDPDEVAKMATMFTELAAAKGATDDDDE